MATKDEYVGGPYLSLYLNSYIKGVSANAQYFHPLSVLRSNKKMGPRWLSRSVKISATPVCCLNSVCTLINVARNFVACKTRPRRVNNRRRPI